VLKAGHDQHPVHKAKHQMMSPVNQKAQFGILE